MSTTDQPHSRDSAKSAPNATNEDTLLQSVMLLCAHHGIDGSERAMFAGLPALTPLEPGLALLALERAGLSATMALRKAAKISEHLFPVILLRKDVAAASFWTGNPATRERYIA